MEINEKLSDLLVLTTRLIDILAKENKLLAERNIREATETTAEKDKLARVYAIFNKELAEEAENLAQADTDLLERLRTAGRKVEALMNENERRIKIALKVSRDVVDAIAQATRPGASTYTSNGVVGGGQRSAETTTKPVTFNRTL